MRTGQRRHRPKRLRLNRELTLACRLCLRLGIDDPEQWLEDCPDRVFEVWDAYAQLEPWWGDREMLAGLLATTRSLLASKYEDRQIEAVLKSVDQITAAYMPGDWVGQPPPVDEQVSGIQTTLEARHDSPFAAKFADGSEHIICTP